MKRPPRQRERSDQAGIVQLLRSLGAQVYVLGTTRRRGDHPGTMQTAGLPDLIVFLYTAPARRQAGLLFPRRLLYVEVKAPGGRLRPQQVQFRDCCAEARVDHLVGGLDAVIAWLIAEGYLQSNQVPHYRGEKAVI